MSDRRPLVRAALVALPLFALFAPIAPRVAAAQTETKAPPSGSSRSLADWRAELGQESERARTLADVFRNRGLTLVYRNSIAVGNLSISFADGTLTSRDSVSLTDGLTAALETLRARHGEAGIALTEGGRWIVHRVDPRQSRVRDKLVMQRATDAYNTFYVGSPAKKSEVEQMVLTYAGERLTLTTPSLKAFSGWAALRPQSEMYSEVARRLAISWSGAARRCASRAIDACAVVVSPFDEKGDPTIYYDPVDFRSVVAAARMPALSDSAYFAERRQCLDGVDSVCVRMIEKVAYPDPFNPMVRGTVLTHAIELGGVGAVARAAEKADAPALETLAHIAGVPQDSLLASWHDRSFKAFEDERGAMGFPLVFASLGWGALLLFAATRRKFL